VVIPRARCWTKGIKISGSDKYFSLRHYCFRTNNRELFRLLIDWCQGTITITVFTDPSEKIGYVQVIDEAGQYQSGCTYHILLSQDENSDKEHCQQVVHTSHCKYETSRRTQKNNDSYLPGSNLLHDKQ
jgi:hypothetical protein